jgi:hypothetical protein
MRSIHLTGIKTKAQCGVKGMLLKTTAKVEEVTCDLCIDSPRFRRMENKPTTGGIQTSGKVV